MSVKQLRGPAEADKDNFWDDMMDLGKARNASWHTLAIALHQLTKAVFEEIFKYLSIITRKR